MKDKQLRKEFEEFKEDVIKVIYDHIPLEPCEYFSSYFIKKAEEGLTLCEIDDKDKISKNCANGLTYNPKAFLCRTKTGRINKVIIDGKVYKVDNK